MDWEATSTDVVLLTESHQALFMSHVHSLPLKPSTTLVSSVVD